MTFKLKLLIFIKIKKMMKRQHPFSITNRPNTTTKKNSLHNTLVSGSKKIIDARDLQKN
jgi:hypothetical protein